MPRALGEEYVGKEEKVREEEGGKLRRQETGILWPNYF